MDARQLKRLELRVEVPVEDMARRAPVAIQSGPASAGASRPSIWASIHPRLLELIRQHRSTLLFVNSRRLAERLAGALNELAGEVLVRSHHGSIAREQRLEVEDLLKSGRLRALVATSSLELGIDMGAIDLVIQIEAPPSVASGLQRIGRAGHHVGAASSGVIFPKFRGDLVACAAVTAAMHAGAGRVDALSAQSAGRPRAADRGDGRARGLVRRRAARRHSQRGAFCLARTPHFEGVLDMLSGRYPSDEFAELRPRLTWDRLAGHALGPRRRAARGHCQRGHDSRPRAVRRLPVGRKARNRPRRRAGRGDGLRVARRRDVPPRRVDMAHRGDHPRSRGGVAGAGRAGQDAVLEGRFGRAAARTGTGHRTAVARARRDAGRGGHRAPSRSSTISTARAAENLLQYLADQTRRRQRRARRPNRGDRALSRRAGRLAGLRALAVWRPRADSLVPGGRRAFPGRARRRRRDDVE